MGLNPVITKTLSPENQMMINCPVFSVDVKISGCFMLRDMVWRGEKHTARHGCQVALHAGKCPINHLIKHMLAHDSDPLHSTEPKVGHLPGEILARIAPVLIMKKAIANGDCTPGERQRLVICNERAGAGVKVEVKQKRASKKTEPITDETVAAATSGDMGAAVTAAVSSTTGAIE